MASLLELYDRRIVNVNVNIIAAGVLALAPTSLAAHVAEHRFAVKPFPTLTLVTFVADAVSDVAVYYLLHWIANHMPREKVRPKSAAYGDMSFLRDATLVQFERACLSPLLYVIALGTQLLLKGAGFRAWSATSIGFCIAIAITRVLHTIWMYRAEIRAREREILNLRQSAGSALEGTNPLGTSGTE